MNSVFLHASEKFLPTKGPFCIVRKNDRGVAYNAYTTARSSISSSKTFQNLLNKKQPPQFAQINLEEVIQITYNDITEPFQYPTSLYSADCSGTAFIVYKQSVSSDCYLRWLPANAAECKGNTYLNIRYYTESRFSISTSSTTKHISILEPTLLAMSPQWNGTSCNNIITSVNIEFHVNNGSIKTVTGSFQYGNISVQNYARAKFSININFIDKVVDSLEQQQQVPSLQNINSSNSELGYNLDEFLTTSDGTLQLITDPDCDQRTATSIKFGTNTMTGCTINFTDCRTMQRIINDFGARYTSLNISVAPNVQIYAPATVQESSTDITAVGGTCTFATSLSIQLFHARNGPLQSYRQHLVGVVYRYDNYATINVDAIVTLPFVFSVQFFDVTEPPKPRFAHIPSLNLALPSDFFYPFVASSDTLN